jgi:hypothetical protein
MTKGLENLPFDGAELDAAVEAINIAVNLLADMIGAPVEIEIHRYKEAGVRFTARWHQGDFSFVVESGGGVPLHKEDLHLFQHFLDIHVLRCLTYVKKEANRAA